MKNKKLLYVLLPAVLAIWGGIFYRIYEAVTESEPEGGSTPVVVPAVQTHLLSDTTRLLANYRDPFLEGGAGLYERPTHGAAAHSQVVVRVPAPTVAVTPPAVVVPPVPWPSIQYKGMIQNAKSATKIALFQMNGKSFMVSEKQAVQDIQITRIYMDSIGVRFRTEEKYFRR